MEQFETWIVSALCFLFLFSVATSLFLGREIFRRREIKESLKGLGDSFNKGLVEVRFLLDSHLQESGESIQAVHRRLDSHLQESGESIQAVHRRLDDFLHRPLDAYVVAEKRKDLPSPFLSVSLPHEHPVSVSELAKDFVAREANLTKQSRFIRYFEGCGAVLDIGCGKGEFLQLCGEHGLKAVGIDSSEDRVRMCQEAGLEAYRADVFVYLKETDQVYDGMMCSHLVEHLGPQEFIGLLKLASRRLQVGGKLVLITPNPRSLRTHLFHFWKDLTHHRFYDLDSVCHVLEQIGFEIVEAGEYDEIEGTRTVEF